MSSTPLYLMISLLVIVLSLWIYAYYRKFYRKNNTNSNSIYYGFEPGLTICDDSNAQYKPAVKCSDINSDENAKVKCGGEDIHKGRWINDSNDDKWLCKWTGSQCVNYKRCDGIINPNRIRDGGANVDRGANNNYLPNPPQTREVCTANGYTHYDTVSDCGDIDIDAEQKCKTDGIYVKKSYPQVDLYYRCVWNGDKCVNSDRTCVKPEGFTNNESYEDSDFRSSIKPPIPYEEYYVNFRSY